MKTILKKNIFNYNKTKNILEFVSKSGDLIDDTEDVKQSDQVYGAKGQTMDNMVKQTRQPNQNNGLFNFAYNYGSSIYGLREDSSVEMIDPEFISSLPSNVINNLNELLDSINDIQLDSNGKNNILKYIHNNFIGDGKE